MARSNGAHCTSEMKLRCRIQTKRWLIPVADRSKVRVCGRPLVGIAGSNPAGGMDVCLLCFVLSGRSLCDGQMEIE